MPASADAVLVLLCDQYRIRDTDLQRFRVRWEKHPDRTVAARWQAGRGAPAIFPAASFSRLASLRGDQGARPLLAEGAAHIDWVDVPAAGIDLDTRTDLRRATRR